MSKKIFVLVSVLFAVLFIHSFTFATIDIANGVERLGNDVRGGIQNAENAIGNTFDNMNNNMNNNMGDNNTNDNDDTFFNTTTDMDRTTGYTTTRTTTDGTDAGLTSGLNNTVWTWLILAIAAIGIVALVWYYATQNTKRD